MEAKAAYDEAYSAYLAHYKKMEERIEALEETDPDAAEELEIEIQNQYKINELMSVHSKAREALFTWGFQRMREHPAYKDNQELIDEMEYTWKYKPSKWSKMAELFLKLD